MITTANYLRTILKYAKEDLDLNDVTTARGRINAVMNVLNVIADDMQFTEPMSPEPEQQPKGERA